MAVVKNSTKVKGVKVLTPKFRVNWPHLFEPNEYILQTNNKIQYGITMLFEKGQDLSALKKAYTEAGTNLFGDQSKWPEFRYPTFKDQGDKEVSREDGTTYTPNGYVKGAALLEAKSKDKPGVVNQKNQEIIDPNEVYSGCYARAVVTFKAYDFQGNKGITCYLQHIQKMADGESLAGRTKPEDEFGVIEEEVFSSPAPSDEDAILGV